VGNLDTAQLEQLKAIGAYLREIRQEQSRSLEEIATKTYIPLRLLRALESGQEQPLPEPVFVQGFIRRYGDILGLDGLELAQQFPVQAAPLSQEPVLQAMGDDSQTAVQTEVLKLADMLPRSGRPRRSRQANSSNPPNLPNLPLLVVGILAIAAVAIGLLKLLLPQSSAPVGGQTAIAPEPANLAPSADVSSPDQSTATSTAPSSQAQTSTTSPPAGSTSTSLSTSSSTSSTAASPVGSGVPTASPGSLTPTTASIGNSSSSSSGNPVNVAVNLTDRVWLQVIVDGKIEFEGTLPKGTQRNWSAKKELTIVSGNAGGVSVAFNDQQSRSMGKLGQVEEMTFKAGSSAPSSSSN
jgi:cytoskeletal protein RodZ